MGNEHSSFSAKSEHSSSMNRISLIYFYLISAVALGLIIVGLFHIGNFVINTTQYDKYPLRYGLENCEYPFLSPKGPYYPTTDRIDAPPATPSAEEAQRQKQICIENSQLDRKQHKLDDIKDSVLYTLIGAVLFVIHFPLARRYSRN